MVIGPLPMPSGEEFSEWCEDALAHGIDPAEMSQEYRKPFVDYICEHYGIGQLSILWGGKYKSPLKE
jgi:hypothetical protein